MNKTFRCSIMLLYVSLIIVVADFGLKISTVQATVPNMESTKYYIVNDSLNFGGTDNSVSSNFKASDTMGEVATGMSSSTNFNISAGYRTLQSSYISISASPDMALPGITGMGGEESIGNTSWKVVTDNVAGYEMYIHSQTAPALHDPATGAFFSDYVPSGASPDYFFSVGTGISTFGFSPEGADIIPRYMDDGISCNVGSYDTQDRCWDGLLTTEKTIARNPSANNPAGAITTVKYQAGIGTNKIQDSGSYTSSISVTAITL